MCKRDRHLAEGPQRVTPRNTGVTANERYLVNYAGQGSQKPSAGHLTVGHTLPSGALQARGHQQPAEPAHPNCTLLVDPSPH